jgi:hypothetical protein
MLARQALYHLTPPPTLLLVMGFFKIGSHELFAQTVFEPQSS